MKFRLVESLADGYLYHDADRELVGDYMDSCAEGIHFFENEQDAHRMLGSGKLRKKIVEYEFNITSNLSPIYVNGDVIFWGADAISNIILAKYNSSSVPVAFLFDNDTKGINSDDIKLDINKFSVRDIIFFSKMAKEQRSDEDSFNAVMSLLRSKGYNCISYIANETHTKAILLPNENIGLIDWDGRKILNRA